MYAGSMSRLLRVAGSAVQVGEIVAMKEQRACFCRRGWYSALGLFCHSTCSILDNVRTRFARTQLPSTTFSSVRYSSLPPVLSNVVIYNHARKSSQTTTRTYNATTPLTKRISHASFDDHGTSSQPLPLFAALLVQVAAAGKSVLLAAATKTGVGLVLVLRTHVLTVDCTVPVRICTTPRPRKATSLLWSLIQLLVSFE